MKDISKIISIVFLSFSILLLCYVFYRSQIFHSGTKSDYYLFDNYFEYYVIAFLFIIFSFISFFIPKKLKINITIVFISILIGLYLVEGCLIITKKYSKFVIYKINIGKDYDKRTKFEIYQDLKKEDPNIVVSVVPFDFENDKNINYLPLSGVSNRKTIHCNENGYYSIYQSDRFGFNTPDEEWDKDKIDYLLVGDSFTHGACVNEPDTISGNLRKLNNNRKGVLNLGQHNSGPLVEYAILREHLPLKKVKRVLWIYSDNDSKDLSRELKNKILVNYLKDRNFSQNIILKKQEIKKLQLKKIEQEVLKQERSEKKRFLEPIEFIKLDLLRNIIFHALVLDPPLPKEFENIIKLSNKLTKENNSKLYFVHLPDYTRYIGKYNQVNLFNYKRVIEIVENLNIPIIDINKELFEKHEDPLSLFPFRKRGHYNELGYQLVAKTIFNKIKELEK